MQCTREGKIHFSYSFFHDLLFTRIWQRFIVVCPSSLVSNWANEFDKWVGKASQPKRVVIKKGGEEGLQLIKSFIPIKPQKSEGTFILSNCFHYQFLSILLCSSSHENVSKNDTHHIHKC